MPGWGSSFRVNQDPLKILFNTILDSSKVDKYVANIEMIKIIIIS